MNPTTDFARDQFLEKPLPSSPDSERVILGAILLDNQLISQAIEHLRSEDFYSPLHRRIFKAMTALFERSERIDPILIGEELKKDGSIESIGGIATITNLTYGLPHFSDIFDYAKVVKDKSIIRSLIKVCNQITSEALAEEDDASDILDHAEQQIFALADERTRQGFAHIRPIAESVLARVEEYAKRETHALTGLATGFRDLDEKTSGLQKTDLIIIAARPSMGKCLEENSLIALKDGRVRSIRDIVKARHARLLTLGRDFKFSDADVSDFVDDGIKPVYRVRTGVGRVIETTLTHPFLTINGWKPLSELSVGDHVAVPRILDVFGVGNLRQCEIKLLAYLIGDGCLTKGSPEFTVENEVVRNDFIDAIREFGGVEAVPCNSDDRAFTLRVRSKKGTGRNPLTGWLRKVGILGHGAHGKFIPDQVFTLDRANLSLFLNRLFSTDGWASVLASGQVQMGYSSVSEQLIRQVQHLLLRFGIIARLKKRSVAYRGTRRMAWQLDITDAPSIKKFINEIGIIGKEKKITEIRAVIEKKEYRTNRDLIPVGIWDHIRGSKGDESWSSVARRANIAGYTNIHVGKRAPTRRRLSALAEALSDAYLADLSRSDIYWDDIREIEYVGERQVYDLTVPGTHNFVANDICVHNTALCLTLAQNAAVQEAATVAVFSLEMSKEQLVMRMLSSEAKVDAHRFRTGYLTRDEWARLAEAIGTLSEAKVFIDDTPGISVLEMRAKLRRLAAEQKRLDLVVVDYMQLMSGSKRTESRQQEVSQISRELKALAKEMQVPVVALSQLSRAPEARNPPKPMMSDLRESGCLAGDSLVTLAGSGRRIPIRELENQKDFEVWALNPTTWKLERSKVTKAFSTGEKPVFRLTTRLGREIRATANHKFLRFDGWERLDKLKSGDRIALPRAVKPNSDSTKSLDEVALLGHLIGDGCTLPRHAIQYTTRELELAEIVSGLASSVFGNSVEPRINRERDWYQVYLTSTKRHTHGVRSAVSMWLEELGIWGLRSFEKKVPEVLFEQDEVVISCFVRHLWATDGCVWIGDGNRAPAVYYATSSSQLASDLQSLLLRLEINASVRLVDQNGKGRPQFHLIISGQPDIVRFIDTVGAVGMRRSVVIDSIRNRFSEVRPNTNRDTIPSSAWRQLVVPVAGEKSITTRELQAGIGMSYCGTALYKNNIGRERLLRIGNFLGSELIKSLSVSDVYWDEIVSIIPDGVSDVYDLTVDEHHNFVAQDIIVHNSIEQDADVVAFIYREDYYKPTEENAGIADILIAKQRNGPTGTVRLAFLKEFTRFENYYGEYDSND